MGQQCPYGNGHPCAPGAPFEEDGKIKTACSSCKREMSAYPAPKPKEDPKK